MGERTPYIDAGYDFVPNESAAFGIQRYGAPQAQGQRGILCTFPTSHLPLALFEALVSSRMKDFYSDGSADFENWAVYNSFSLLFDNWGYHNASPWGGAIRFQQTGVNNANFGFGYRNTWLFRGSIYDDPDFDRSYVVFCVVRNSAINNWFRTMFTLGSGQAESYQYQPVTDILRISSIGVGTTNLDISLANLHRDDGWMLFAFRQKPINNLTGTVDIWYNGVQIASDAVAPINHLGAKNQARIGQENTAKDGLSWHGLISHISVIVTDTPMAEEEIQRWFEDPWWFHKAERLSLFTIMDGDNSLEASTQGGIGLNGGISSMIGADAPVSIEVNTGTDAAADISVVPVDNIGTVNTKPAIDGDVRLAH